MNVRTHMLSGLNKCGLILCTAVLGFAAQRACAQWYQPQILQDLPPNYNQQPRYDTSGNIVDAHDGMLVQFGNTFYLYGTSYGNTGGFADSNYFSCYTSTNLVTWTLAATNLLNYNPADKKIFFRPHVMYNQANNYYVLWYNWFYGLDNGYSSSTGYLGVATSPSPLGPFINNVSNFFKQGVGDLNVFVDNDTNQTAYMIYTMLAGSFQISVERLKPSYLDFTGSKYTFSTSGEGPLLFKKDSTYYAMLSTGGCCSCPNGASSWVFEAANPLGPYTAATPYDINSYSSGTHIIPAQQTYVARIPTMAGDKYIWMGDLWSANSSGGQACWSANEPGHPDRGTNMQYWSSPLEFLSNNVQSLAKASNTGTLVLTNLSGQTSGDNLQIMAIPDDGSASVLLATHTGNWYTGTGFSASPISLSGLTSGKYYTLELQDLFNGGTNLIPSMKPIVMNSSMALSAYTYRLGTGGYYGGGYWGWFVAWDAPRSFDLLNGAAEYSGDNEQVMAIPTDGSASVLLGSHTGNWNPGVTWSMDLTPLSIGKTYTVELQDLFNGMTNVIPLANNIIGGMPFSGYVNRPGSDAYGGYWGWYTIFDGQPSTLTLTNNSNQTFNDNVRVVAYLTNNVNQATVIGTMPGPWYPGSTWTLSLSPLRVGYSYTFELQDTSVQGYPVIPSRSDFNQVISSKPLGTGGYIYYGFGGYNGWSINWGWQ